jgi:hypothetical protein
MKKILRQVDVIKVSQRPDDSVDIVFRTTLEQSESEFNQLHPARKTTGTLYYKSDEGLSTDEITQIDKVTLDKPSGKSNSVRLRNVLYVYCKQKIGKEPTKEQFADFYNKYMEKYITYIKDQLDEV